MYPTLSDLIKDLFGIYIPLPIQSYGLMVAIAFLTGAYFLMIELKRKEKEGLLSPIKKKILKGKPAGTQELLISGLVGFVIGMKLVGIILNYKEFNDNPQDYILSMQGNLAGGIIIGIISAYFKYSDKKKEKRDKPVWEEITIHPYQLTSNFVILAAVFGLLGAKIFHNLENIDELIKDPIGSLISFSGLTYYGGLIVAAAALIIYGRRNNIHWRYLIDTAAPAIMLAYAIGRIGCMISGDGCWGIENLNPKPVWLSFLPDWAWTYNFPHNVLREGMPVKDCCGKYCFALENPVYPTQLYETAMCIILFLALWFTRKKIKTPGILFSIFLIMSGVERFLIEQIRVNNKYHIGNLHITQAEIISVILLISGIAGLWYFNKNKTVQQKS